MSRLYDCAFPQQDARLFLASGTGWESVRLRAEPAGPLLHFVDRQQQPRLRLFLDPNGNPAAQDQAGKSLWK